MIFKFRSDKPEQAFKKITEYVRGKDDWFVVEIQYSKKIRSLNQNRYYWGVVVKIIADHTGYLSEEAHQILAKKFLSYQTTDFVFVLSTAKLNSFDFEKYLDKCRTWAKEEMDVHIPMPNEIDEEAYMHIQNLKEP